MLGERVARVELLQLCPDATRLVGLAEVQYQPVGTPADLQSRLDALKAQGKKVAVLLVANPDGETRFVALSLQ